MVDYARYIHNSMVSYANMFTHHLITFSSCVGYISILSMLIPSVSCQERLYYSLILGFGIYYVPYLRRNLRRCYKKKYQKYFW